MEIWTRADIPRSSLLSYLKRSIAAYLDGVSYNVENRTKRLCPNRDIPRMNNYDLTIDLLAGEHGSPQLTIGRKVGGKWIREETRIDTSNLR